MSVHPAQTRCSARSSSAWIASTELAVDGALDGLRAAAVARERRARETAPTASTDETTVMRELVLDAHG